MPRKTNKQERNVNRERQTKEYQIWWAKKAADERRERARRVYTNLGDLLREAGVVGA